uniref:Protein transport protein Sec24C n=1 Tax=Glossina palpalis gambiensis TaxID=67801 RepID=A0A1B0BJ89_9MUSC
MMNPNAYGPPPAMQPTQQMMPGVPGGQQSIPQQQYPGWSPQGPVQGSPAVPPSGSVPSNVPLSSIPQTGIVTRNVLNGNYQQQLTQSMGAMTVNPVKQPPLLQQQAPTGPPTSVNNTFNNANVGVTSSVPHITPNTNGPPMYTQPLPQQHMQSRQPQNTPPMVNNNYVPYPNGVSPSQAPTTNLIMPPTASSASGVAPPPIIPVQSVVGGPNQMSVKSNSLPDMPHMPPPVQKPTQTPAFMPPITGQPTQMSGFTGMQQSVQPTTMGQYNTQPHAQISARPSQPLMMPPSMTGAAQQNQAAMPGQMMMPGYPQQSQHTPTGYPTQAMAPPPPPQSGQQVPGRPGFHQLPTPATGMYQPPPQPYQQARRLDPDQMPNPIQVMIENQRNAGGPFVTNQAGLLPPLVTTKYVVQDQGNSSPRFVRSSLYCIPSTADLLKTTALPFALIISPYARIIEGEYEPPIVDFGVLGPIRCNRCKAYMSPNMQFVDAGRRFQCLMCKVSTEVPTEYFQHLDHTGQRVDRFERPELVLGAYEFLATKDYCRNNESPEIPAFIFVIDVSYNTMKSGLVHLLCSQIKRILKHLPIDQGQHKSKMRVGFITFNSTVHFYNIKSNLAQPQMMVVGDVQDMFMPLLDGFLCDPEESETLIDALMEQIPKMFLDTKETETILYPAIQAGMEALKASNCCGKLLIFNSTLPIADAPGKLKNRDDRKLLGTDKEKTVLTPQCQNYNQLGQECVQNGCSVDMFLFNNAYIDIATIGQVARLSGGEIYKYTYFQAEIDGKRLVEDIIKNVSRPIAFDAVMRVRSSAGIRATDFYGHFFMTNTTDVELASIDCNKSIAIEIKHDDKLPPEENVYLQIALLYTSCSGQRRLRVFNLALKATTTIADVFKSCDLDAMMLFFAKQACFKLMELTPKVVKENLIHRSAQILACYRKHCTSPTSAGQLILPECLKLLPLYVSCLLKNDAISGGSDMTLDDRSYVIHFVLSMDLNTSVTHLYPRFIPIHNVDADVDDGELPMSIRCTHEKMTEDGAYVLENGVHFFVWLGQSLSANFIKPLFGVQCTQQVNAERFAISGDTRMAQRIRNIIEKIMLERTRYMRITCVRQNDKLESVFRHFLIEDRGTDGSASYVDFLCHMHKEIKELLS